MSPEISNNTCARKSNRIITFSKTFRFLGCRVGPRRAGNLLSCTDSQRRARASSGQTFIAVWICCAYIYWIRTRYIQNVLFYLLPDGVVVERMAVRRTRPSSLPRSWCLYFEFYDVTFVQAQPQSSSLCSFELSIYNETRGIEGIRKYEKKTEKSYHDPAGHLTIAIHGLYWWYCTSIYLLARAAPRARKYALHVMKTDVETETC